jgi:hypothetical protein
MTTRRAHFSFHAAVNVINPEKLPLPTVAPALTLLNTDDDTVNSFKNNVDVHASIDRGHNTASGG